MIVFRNLISLVRVIILNEISVDLLRHCRRDFGLPEDPPSSQDDKRPGHIDACHAMRADGPLIKEIWPQFYEGEAREDRDGKSKAEK